MYRSIFSEHGDALLRRSVGVLEMFVNTLRRLRRLGEVHATQFGSEGFRRFFDQLHAELDDDYFAEIDAHLKRLRMRDGVLMSAYLGDGNRGTGYSLRRPRPENVGGFFNRTPLKKPTFTLTIADRDEAGFRELRNHGVDLMARALAQSATMS